MSVINQMLKDLEQRTPEPGQAPIPTLAAQKPSTLKIVLISVVVLLSLNALGFYIWSLQERVAKSESPQTSQAQAIEAPKKTQLAAEPSNTVAAELPTKEQKTEPVKLSKINQPAPVIKKATAVNQVVAAPVSDTPITSLPTKTVKPTNAPVEAEISNTPEPAKMSVSRRQLTEEELISQKLAKAEKSVNLNELTKAEQLFEEVLIIEPAHKQARKKLAALWFGRKSYQQALNLLSQGIAIDKQDGELRLLKARIHLKQGQFEAAFNTLKPLASFEQEEYQVMLANIAQQIEQYSSAIGAYQVLINMQPYSGRWHLGLAIIYDKTSQFSLAINEYALALTKADLSASSAKFAEQRMQALGE